MPRAVLDTNVLVSALITPRGASAELLMELRAGAFELVVSPRLLTELGEILDRPKFRRYLAKHDLEIYVELIHGQSIVVDDPAPSSAPVGADPDDEYLIDLARAAQVDVLVSGDTHLLELRGLVPVMSPREFLQALAPP